MNSPKVWLTSMSQGGEIENIREIISPISEWLNGVIWTMHDAPTDDEGVKFLEAAKGDGKVIHRFYNQRNYFSMNETLFSGLIQEGDFVIWTDALERPMPEFVSRIHSEIGPMMVEADLDVIFAWGKAFLIRYREGMEYGGTPHWYLQGWNGRGIEWSTVEADENKVRKNMRPIKRTDDWHWVGHYARYFIQQPAGSNCALLGLEKQGNPQQLFPVREKRRLEFRKAMKGRGYELTLKGLKEMLSRDLDPWLKGELNVEKTWSDYYNYEILGLRNIKHTHDPKDMIPIL